MNMRRESNNIDARLRGVLAARFQSLVNLKDADYRLLQRIRIRQRRYRKNEDICQQGELKRDLVFLESGLAFSYRYMTGGGRQIIDLHFPGDFIGLSELESESQSTGICALTDSSVLYVGQQAAKELLDNSPRIARAWYVLMARQQRILTERFISTAHLPADQCVAHLLLEMRERTLCSASYMTGASSYRLLKGLGSSCSSTRISLPQTIVADLLGLSIVHVNRTLKYLRQRGLVGACNRGIELIDIQGLKRAAFQSAEDDILGEKLEA